LQVTSNSRGATARPIIAARPALPTCNEPGGRWCPGL